MRLLRLKLFGFKSFAEKTIIHFHEGITGIVGPNGCGKSNTADAIRWVMGEQSAKSMRGKNMPDIIFAGTAKRKALNICEVSITFSNEKRILPVDFEEVEVTRILHRSGESEYLINGQQVRLKDVHDLLLDTGVGKNSFAIFEQGKIDQIINFSPKERRSIFEDAAGILRFLVEKQRAMRKLEHVDNNMSRVQDIHKEVEKQIVVKERQVEKAKAYKSNRAEFEGLEKGLFLTRFDRLDKKRLSVSEHDESEKGKLAAKAKQLEEALALVAEKKQTLGETENAFRQQNENVYKTKSEREIKLRERQNREQRLAEMGHKQQRWAVELEAIVEKRKTRESEKEKLVQSQSQVAEKLAGLEAVTKEQWSQVCQEEQTLGDLRKEQQKAHHQYVMLMEAEKKIESDLKQNTVRLEHNQERKRQFQERRSQMEKHLGELAAQIVEKETLLGSASTQIDAQKAELRGYEEKLESVKKEIQEIKREMDSLNKLQAEAQARKKALERLRLEMEGFSPGTKKLLKDCPQVQGLYELIAPEAGAEAAVSTVMKPYMQTLVVKTRDDFDAVITFAKENGVKEFSLLCLEDLDSLEADVSYTSLVTKVSDSGLSRHFLHDVAVASDAKQAIELIKQNPSLDVWTDEGVYVDGKKVVFYVSQGENNVFMREAELKSLSKSINERARVMEEKEKLVQELSLKHGELDAGRFDLDRTIRQAEMKLVEVNFAFQRAKSDREKTANDVAKIDLEIAAAVKAIETHEQTLAALHASHANAQQEAVSHKERSTALSSQVEQLSVLLKQEQEKLKQKESHLQSVIEEHRKVAHSLNVLEVQDLESVQQQQRLSNEIESAKVFQKEMKECIEADIHQLEDVEKALTQVLAVSNELELQVGAQKKHLEETEASLEGIRQEIKQIESRLYEVGIEMTQIMGSLEAIQVELQERYTLTIADAKAEGIVLEIGTEEAEKSIRRLRRLLEESGDINMASIEEFEELKSRYEFLNQQLDDLAVSKKELIEIITQLDVESRKMFEETFEQVRKNFQKNFAILFNGGEADLLFTEGEEDILDAGIDIVAKPPGKQMRSISLLSGGEKCMTAMALLFAIFEVKTAPFCILDEVDAPLDDSNIARFVNVVKQFTGNCQFVIITHNKRTMSICDRLFGVSMQERGVSKLLSIEFSKEQTPEPALV